MGIVIIGQFLNALVRMKIYIWKLKSSYIIIYKKTSINIEIYGENLKLKSY